MLLRSTLPARLGSRARLSTFGPQDQHDLPLCHSFTTSMTTNRLNTMLSVTCSGQMKMDKYNSHSVIFILLGKTS
ncbi:unnamed protein product [Rhodiola kirilowii]